jgi:hypothetical protein
MGRKKALKAEFSGRFHIASVSVAVYFCGQERKLTSHLDDKRRNRTSSEITQTLSSPELQYLHSGLLGVARADSEVGSAKSPLEEHPRIAVSNHML